MRAFSRKRPSAGLRRRRAPRAHRIALAFLCLVAATGCAARGPAAESGGPAIVPLALEQDRQFRD